MAAKFEIYQDKGGEYRFRLKAGNGEIVATGESYPTLDGARAGVDAVKRAAAAADAEPDLSGLDQGITHMRGRQV